MAGADEGEAREALRARLLTATPRWYRPWAHLAFPSVVGLAAIAVALAVVRAPAAVDLLTLPAALVVLNAIEWIVHRYAMHRRVFGLQILYDRHTPEHHRVYTHDHMPIREARELRLVLIPAYGILAILAATLPVTAGIWALAGRNVAALWLAITMAYAVSYEWLHLSYHLPPDGVIGRRALIRRLRRHHQVHHRPELMQRWNMNVTLPLWDWVLGTIHRDERAAAAGAPAVPPRDR